MKRIAFACLLTVLGSHVCMPVYAAEAPAQPCTGRPADCLVTPAPPAAPQFTGTFSETDVQMIVAAMAIAAQQCGQDEHACVIGLNRQGILMKFKPAAPPGK